MSESSRRRFLKRVITGAGIAAGPAVLAQSPGVRAFDHVALPMQNVEAMVAFYRALGFDVEENPQVCVAHFGTQMINFHRPRSGSARTSRCVRPRRHRRAETCASCGTAPRRAEGRARSSVKVKVEEGPVARQGGRRTNGSSTYIRDPDGNLLEFIIY